MDSKETIDNGQTSEQNNQQFIELNGEQIDIEELKKGYLRQSDYTKKTQEIAEQRKEFEKLIKTVQQPQEEDDVVAAKNFIESYLKESGYVRIDEAEKLIEPKLQELKMEKFFDNNPELEQHRKAIEAISKVDSRPIDEIVIDYNFTTNDKLAKAKASKTIVGDKNRGGEVKEDISKMNSEQYNAWKAKNGLKAKSILI